MDRDRTRVIAFPFTESIDSSNGTILLDSLNLPSRSYFIFPFLIMSMALDLAHNRSYMSTAMDSRLLIWDVVGMHMQLIDAVRLFEINNQIFVRPYLIDVEQTSSSFHMLDANSKALYQFNFNTTQGQGIQINITYPNNISLYFDDMKLVSPHTIYLTDSVHHRVVQLALETGALRTVAGE